jgi:hypothetical protein
VLVIYGKNIKSKRLVKKKDIPNLPTCVVVGNNGGNHFIATNFDYYVGRL